MKFRVSKSFILFVISIVFIIIIISYIGVYKIVKILMNVNITYVLLAIILQFVVMLVMALRWRCITKLLGYNPSLKNVFLLVLMGQFLNNITPSMRGGGEAFRAYYLSKLEDIPKGLAFSTVVVERVLDTSIFLFFTLFVIGYFIIVGFKYLEYLIIAWIFLFSTTAIILYLIANKKLLIKIIKKLSVSFCRYCSYTYNEEKILKSIDEFYNSIKFLKKSRGKKAYIIILLSIGWFIIDIIKLWMLFLSLPYNVSIIRVAAVYLLTLLTGVLSITPSGFGTADAVMILSFSAFGISPSIAAAVAILDRLVSYIIPTIIGYIATIIINRDLK